MSGTIIVPSRWLPNGDIFRDGDLTTLRALRHATGPQSVYALAETTGLSESAVRSAVALLVADGWATRAPNPNPGRLGPRGFAYTLKPTLQQAIDDVLILGVRVREARALAEKTNRKGALDTTTSHITAPIAVDKGQRLPAAERATLIAWLRERYVGDGCSIRQLMCETGRSYGAVRQMLVEAGVTLRSRGAPRRHPKP